MRALLVAAVVGATVLVLAGPAATTTNAPAIFTVKVTIGDHQIAMHPSHAARGSTITFILTNRGKRTQTFVLGDVARGAGKGQGFAQVLRPDQQFTKVMFLDYRGVMRFVLRYKGTISARGTFVIT